MKAFCKRVFSGVYFVVSCWRHLPPPPRLPALVPNREYFVTAAAAAVAAVAATSCESEIALVCRPGVSAVSGVGAARIWATRPVGPGPGDVRRPPRHMLAVRAPLSPLSFSPCWSRSRDSIGLERMPSRFHICLALSGEFLSPPFLHCFVPEAQCVGSDKSPASAA